MVKETTEPCDRSKPPEAITNSCPIAKIARGATRLTNARIPSTVAKLGLY